MEVQSGGDKVLVGTKELNNFWSNFDNYDCIRSARCVSCNLHLNLGGGEARTCRFCGATGRTCYAAHDKAPISPLATLGAVLTPDGQGVVFTRAVKEVKREVS